MYVCVSIDFINLSILQSACVILDVEFGNKKYTRVYFASMMLQKSQKI